MDTVLTRALSILTSFRTEDHSLSLAEVVRRSHLPKTTAHRLLAELVTIRLVERNDAGAYRLGSRLFELGMLASVERGLLEVAMPFLQDLYERSHETVHLGLLEGAEVVYVTKIGGHRQAQTPSRVGGRMPLHCTAIGKALLAHAGDELFRQIVASGLERRTAHTIIAPGLLRRQLRRTVSTGVAFEREESSLGVVCIAAPVLDRQDHPLAAVSVAGPSSRFRPEQHVAAVRAAAGGIGATLARRAQLLEANDDHRAPFQ